MIACHRVFSGTLLLALVGASHRARAQVITKQYDQAPVVFADHIEAVYPEPYFIARRPSPPERGFYAWKLIFGDRDATVVFRTDSAIASTNAREIVRSGALYRCELPEQPLLTCRARIAGSMRVEGQSVVLDISDTSVVRLIRRLRPTTVWRQWFEPGGRFRVDQLTVNYRDPPPR